MVDLIFDHIFQFTLGFNLQQSQWQHLDSNIYNRIELTTDQHESGNQGSQEWIFHAQKIMAAIIDDQDPTRDL